ncbi:putative protein MSS51, mitochondrial [Hypsizygus marmoreus]|uniref:MYND-type domain-containing protein n=1 Tax=Hypsizygus marmoreus TaxID=39966 RepID=A0A369JEQ5_HYPMA|nr:putative protein MSS51, mitochondrial [Hypsizygus marmoreus]
MEQLQRIPPVTAVIGQACYACFKGEGAGVTLQKCTKCRSVRYCGPACQKADWKQHKGICRALHKLENDPTLRFTLLLQLADAPATRLYDLDTVIGAMTVTQARYVQQVLGRPLTVPERNLMGWEPKCMGCGRTDRIMRMEAEKNEGSSEPATPNTLKPCPACKMAFYCTEKHWRAVEHFHAGEPCEDGHDGLSQCHMNQEIRMDIGLREIMLQANAGEFRWAPERVKPAWVSLKGSNWEKEFGTDIMEAFRVSEDALGTWLRAVSEGLTMPMTILSALEIVNNDDSWTRRDTLTIHILGAFEAEIMKADMFEEILHRLAEVKSLRLVMCGPQLSQIGSARERSRDIVMDTCPNCTRTGRRRIQVLYATTYHDFGQSQKDKFIKPDLAIAFNSGASQESSQSWRDTMSFLVKNKVPTVFTAYNREEAEVEAKMLQQAGATLEPALGPLKNAWGSLSMKQEPNRVTGFYAANGWLAGGFR